MELLGFPNCCTAGVMIGMGRSSTAGHTGVPYGQDYTKTTFCEAARKCLRQAGRQNYGIVFAITNSDQKLAEECLPLLGFVCGHKEVGKNGHADKTITSWSYQVTKEDRQPKAVPANPFVKAKPEPAPRREDPPFEPPVAGIDALLHQREIRYIQIEGSDIPYSMFAGERDVDVEEWLKHPMNRPRINRLVRANNRRDDFGRYRAQPIPGKMYTYPQLRDLWVGRDSRFRRILSTYGSVGTHQNRSQRGVADMWNRPDIIGFVFA